MESHKRPLLSEVRVSVDIRCLYTDNDCILLLVRKLTPPALIYPDTPGGRAARLLDDEPTRIYFQLFMRPLIMQARHANASCHLGIQPILYVLERMYWWIGMNVCTRWWLRRCLQYQASKPSRQTVRWPHILFLRAIRPWCHGERRLLRLPPRHTSGKLLHSTLRG